MIDHDLIAVFAKEAGLVGRLDDLVHHATGKGVETARNDAHSTLRHLLDAKHKHVRHVSAGLPKDVGLKEWGDKADGLETGLHAARKAHQGAIDALEHAANQHGTAKLQAVALVGGMGAAGAAAGGLAGVGIYKAHQKLKQRQEKKAGFSVGMHVPAGKLNKKIKKHDPEGRLSVGAGIGTTGPTGGASYKIGKGFKTKDGRIFPTIGVGIRGPTIGFQHVKRRQEKRADDPGEALTANIKGLKQPRKYTPRLRMGTKGQTPVNPFSGNKMKPVKLAQAPKEKTVAHAVGQGVHLAKGLGRQAAGAASKVWHGPVKPVAHTALGVGALIGAGYVGHKAYKAWKNPYGQPTGGGQGEAAAIHGVRGLQYVPASAFGPPVGGGR